MVAAASRCFAGALEVSTHAEVSAVSHTRCTVRKMHACEQSIVEEVAEWHDQLGSINDQYGRNQAAGTIAGKTGHDNGARGDSPKVSSIDGLMESVEHLANRGVKQDSGSNKCGSADTNGDKSSLQTGGEPLSRKTTRRTTSNCL